MAGGPHGAQTARHGPPPDSASPLEHRLRAAPPRRVVAPDPRPMTKRSRTPRSAFAGALPLPRPPPPRRVVPPDPRPMTKRPRPPRSAFAGAPPPPQERWARRAPLLSQERPVHGGGGWWRRWLGGRRRMRPSGSRVAALAVAAPAH